MTASATSPFVVSRVAAEQFDTAPGATVDLPAEPDTCHWGYIDASLAPVRTMQPGDRLTVEAVTHHAGDAPDLMFDDRIRALWSAIPEGERTPGVHLITGPVAVAGAKPGDALAVRIESMTPRLPYGSNCAAHWGFLYDRFQKERITIYELDDATDGASFGPFARPKFAYDFTGRDRYDIPGFITEPDPTTHDAFTRDVQVPVRPHFGVMGVAPATDERISSIPPGPFGGNVDNWRFGPGATVYYPVFREGAGLYFGDPHFGQGDGEICGTAIEASCSGVVRVGVATDLHIETPVLETDTHVFTHGFGADLDEAARMACEQMLALLMDRAGLSADDAYSLMSVALDLGITQVVDATIGAHVAVPTRVFV